MARSALAVQAIVIAGLEPAFTAANVDGHSVQNDGRTVLYVKNGSVGSVDVTIQTPGAVGGNAIADRVIAVPAGEDRIIGTFAPSVYNRGGSTDAHSIYVDFSAVTTVTVAALRV